MIGKHPFLMISPVKSKIVQTVQNDLVDEHGAAKSKRRTWRHSGKAVSITVIVAVTVEGGDVVVIVGEGTVVTASLACVVDEVDIVGDVANLRQSRNNYSHIPTGF
jgi:hypothetical protein